MKTGIKLNKDKLQYRRKEILFHGHQLSKNGLTADPAKIEAVAAMPAPKDKAGMVRLLGTVNYLRTFAQHLSTVSKPLRSLTKDDSKFIWDEVHEAALTEITKIMTEGALLAYFDPALSTTLQCDAPQYGLGAMLLQNGKPVCYASRALTPTEQQYVRIEKELLSVVFGCEKFDMYVYGKAVVVETDHKPLDKRQETPHLGATATPKNASEAAALQSQHCVP